MSLAGGDHGFHVSGVGIRCRVYNNYVALFSTIYDRLLPSGRVCLEKTRIPT